jgi:hypothetical protein
MYGTNTQLIMKSQLKKLIFSTILLFTTTIFSQEAIDSTVQTSKGELSYMLYVDTYYGYDLNQPYSGNRPPFLYQYNRDNEFNINMGLVDLNYKNDKLEANLGFNVGTFPQTYYAGADTLLNTVYQANIKYIASKKFDICFGMFAPHFGFESILSYDNMTVSQSLISEGTPYYISGVKAYFHPTPNWSLGAVIANGWQNLHKKAGARGNGYGVQANYLMKGKIEFNYSNYFYDDSQTSLWGFYNEVYLQKWFSKKFRLTVGSSVAAQEHTKPIGVFTTISQYKFNKKWAVAARLEYVNDQPLLFYSTPNNETPFKVGGYSANIDWSPAKMLKFRIEGRLFTSSRGIFRNDREYNPETPIKIVYSNNDANILFSVQVKID